MWQILIIDALSVPPLALGTRLGGADQVFWPVPCSLLSNLGPTKSSMLCF